MCTARAPVAPLVYRTCTVGGRSDMVPIHVWYMIVNRTWIGFTNLQWNTKHGLNPNSVACLRPTLWGCLLPTLWFAGAAMMKSTQKGSTKTVTALNSFYIATFFQHLILYSSPHHRTHVWLQVLYVKWFWASSTLTATGWHCTSPIGSTKAYETRRAFLKQLGDKEKGTQQKTIDGITALHEGVINAEKTFDGGCDFLLNWYRTNF